jgi:Tfp pilus assembly protein PilF
MKDSLQTAMYKGVRRVQFVDRSVDYQSIDDMRKALADLDDQLSTDRSERRSYAAFSKG